MKSVGTYEAKTHLPRLLSQVEKGESITITKRGKPIAKLVPADAAEQKDEAGHRGDAELPRPARPRPGG